jgi:hypothetical protein
LGYSTHMHGNVIKSLYRYLKQTKISPFQKRRT